MPLLASYTQKLKPTKLLPIGCSVVISQRLGTRRDLMAAMQLQACGLVRHWVSRHIILVHLLMGCWGNTKRTAAGGKRTVGSELIFVGKVQGCGKQYAVWSELVWSVCSHVDYISEVSFSHYCVMRAIFGRDCERGLVSPFCWLKCSV